MREINFERKSMIRAYDELPPAAPPLVDLAELRRWVLLEDNHLLVIDKPGWLVVHPSKNGPRSSLAGAVREEFKPDAIRFIYRLDRETSGVIILAQTEALGGGPRQPVFPPKITHTYLTFPPGQ